MKRATVAKVIAGLILVVGGAQVFRVARWFVFETRIHNVLAAVPKHPRPADLVLVKPRVLEEARSLWLVTRSLELDVRLEQHDSVGRALKEDIAEKYWFVVVVARYGDRTATWDERIENKVAETDADELERLGVHVKRAKSER